jgi:hypothetical protein
MRNPDNSSRRPHLPGRDELSVDPGGVLLVTLIAMRFA